MKVKPWPILIIAFIHIFAPVFNILWSAEINHISVYDYCEYLFYNNNFVQNIFWFVLPVIAGLSILKFRKWSYFLILAFTFSFSILLLKDYVSSVAFPFHFFIFAEAVNLIVFSYFLHPAVRNVYLNKNLRWWEQKPRYLIEHPIQLKYKEAIYEGQIKNISEGGCLIQLGVPIDRLERFMVSFEIFQRKFHAESQAVFGSSEGIGIFFLNIHPSQNEFNKVIDQLANQGYPLRSQPPKWTESFSVWVKALIRGKGFIPQLDTKDSVVIRSSPHTSELKKKNE